MIEIIPEWIEKLEDEDLVFIKKICFGFRFFKKK